MVAYALFVTFTLGLFLGIVGTVTTAIRMEERAERQRFERQAAREREHVVRIPTGIYND